MECDVRCLKRRSCLVGARDESILLFSNDIREHSEALGASLG